MCVIFLGRPQRAKLKDELSTQIAEVNTFRALPASISRSFTVSARTLSAPDDERSSPAISDPQSSTMEDPDPVKTVEKEVSARRPVQTSG